MKERVQIPAAEYQERIKKAAAMAADRGLDVFLVNGNEADYANTRYFSGFWPVFENSGVAITPAGDASLLVGPESGIFAQDTGFIDDVVPMHEYRESADPDFPHVKFPSFKEVFEKLGVKGGKIRIGVASLLDTNVIVWRALQEAYPEAELVDAGDIMVSLREIKSPNEILCLKEASRITKIATEDVIAAIRPGITELELIGVAQKSIYENGAEYEGLPMYCFSQESTKHAISRSGYKEIQRGDVVQLNLSAAIDGYSPSIGLPVSVGPLQGEKKDIVDFIWEVHEWTEAKLGPGVPAAEIATEYEKLFMDGGFKDAYLYGPAHGLGLTEVEAPWMETSSTYDLAPNMTFQIDSFGMGSDFGVRWEKPVVITESGIELLSPQIGERIELDF